MFRDAQVYLIMVEHRQAVPIIGQRGEVVGILLDHNLIK